MVGSGLVSRLEGLIIDRMSDTRVPGLSVALIRGGEVVYSRGFGYRDVEQMLPATSNTIYGVGSITKTFTAVSILQLVEKGLLSLDDRVGDILGFGLKARGEDVRVHHLLTHTSGIPSLGYAAAFITSMLGLGGRWLPLSDPGQTFSYMSGAAEWASHKPGERFFYLNEGYVLLGLIVEKVSGLKYEKYVEKNILEPLGMSRSHFTREEVVGEEDVAAPYIVSEKGVTRSKFPYGVTADGGLLSSVLDMSRMVVALMNRGRLGDSEILGSRYVELMEEPRITIPSFQVFGGEAYGYGVIVAPSFPGGRLIWHSGSILVHTGFYGYMPEKRMGVVVLSNASGYPPGNIGMYALTLLQGMDPEETLPFIRHENLLRMLEGTYHGYKDSVEASVKRLGDFLTLEYMGGVGGRYVLILDRVEDNHIYFWTSMNTAKITAEFIVEGDNVTLFFDRYKLVRVGRPRVK